MGRHKAELRRDHLEQQFDQLGAKGWELAWVLMSQNLRETMSVPAQQGPRMGLEDELVILRFGELVGDLEDVQLMDASGSGPLRLKVACCRARRVVGNGALRVLGSVVAIPRPMRPCARPGFDGRPELRPVGGGDAESDRGAGGAEGLARGEDDGDHGVLALLTEVIFEWFGHIAHHTSSVRPTSSAPKLRANCLRRRSSSLSSVRIWLGTVTRRFWGLTIAFAHPTASRRRAIMRRTRFPSSDGRGGARPRPPARQRRLQFRGGRRARRVRCRGGPAARGSSRPL